MIASGNRSWRVVWTGTRDCRALAELLADDRAVHARRDSLATMVETRANLHVAPQLPAIERCSVAVPHDVDLGGVDQVVATVGGGPHSTLAAATAARIAQRLGIPGRIVTGYRRPDRRPTAERALSQVAALGIDLPMEAVAAAHPSDLVASLPARAMVVVGAPGGSWFQRQFFGPGVRLRVGAPGGVVVVRQDVTRVYQVMGPARAVGGHMRVRSVLELTSDRVVLVADHGRLIGSVQRSRLYSHPSHVEIGALADPPVAVAADEPVEHILLVLDEHDGGPVGVVAPNGQLIGSVSAQELDEIARHRKEEAS